MVKLVINAAGTMLAIAQSRLRPIKLVAWRFHSFLISPITDQPEDAAPYHNESPCVQSMCLFPVEPLFTFTRYGANVTQTTYFRPLEKESTRSAPGTCFLLSWRRTRTRFPAFWRRVGQTESQFRFYHAILSSIFLSLYTISREGVLPLAEISY